MWCTETQILKKKNTWKLHWQSREKTSYQPVSLHLRVKQLASQWTDCCDISCWEILLEFRRENWNFFNIGQKYEALYMRSCVVVRETPLGKKYSQPILRKTKLSQGKGLCCLRWYFSDLSPVGGRGVGAQVFLCVSFVYKQSLDDNRVALKMDHTATFSSP